MVRLVENGRKRIARAITVFQFQCGAIGSLVGLIMLIGFFSFNSSVVRLVACMFFPQSRNSEFQFQCGAIGSGTTATDIYLYY